MNSHRPAYLGGEIKFHSEQDCWLISNRSGRFGRNKSKSQIEQEQVLQTLESVARRVSAQLGIDAVVRCGFKQPLIDESRVVMGKVQ